MINLLKKITSKKESSKCCSVEIKEVKSNEENSCCEADNYVGETCCNPNNIHENNCCGN
ncbi:hypothetical protein [Schinkia azotoformans]|uniref:hypothetical protein n=1 Tax=Schinkia azotoformans TaxID=1454 RepID=UPI002DB5D9B3|nr:hypothetical protein [Schinkia azotoformans]MEC1718918.1 hypothetical protein [Schinkia azotoformans]MED4412870.1 hypothetical protein [Schinkia azotoformans]